MMQVAVRGWSATAVHDTVDAVMHSAAFQRSLPSTLLQRMGRWLLEGLRWLARQLGGLPEGRTLVIWGTATIIVLLLVRAAVVAGARDDGEVTESPRAGRAAEGPWRLAERLAVAGDHAGAAHALYRGVLASLAAREHLRLDPSKTSGDYARELRRRGSGAHQPFRAFARRFDDAVYGHAPVDASLVADLRTLAAPLRDAARAA
jgi:hypothetical protein